MVTLRPATFRSTRRVLPVLLAVLPLAGRGGEASGQSPRFRRWEIAATVIDVVDPFDVFTDVRLGDPVRGTLTFDYGSENTSAGISYPASQFELVTMVIENPRTGGELAFVSDESWVAIVSNDVTDWDDPTQTYDSLIAGQSVAPPAGYPPDEGPQVWVELRAPDVLHDRSWPADLNLDDWPYATIYFWNLGAADVLVDAEIYSLTPAPVAFAPGDFDGTKTIDGDDLADWRNWFGVNHYADADGDGDSDGADFLIWQRQLGAAVTAASRAAPEPSTACLLAVALVIAAARGRRETAS